MIETNLKPRLLYCFRCKTDTTNRDPFPKCKVCGLNLITVAFRVLDGTRITGILKHQPLTMPGAKK